jgi:hypothetical protein
MRTAVLLLIAMAAAFASGPRNPEHDTNVNSRYVVEAIEVAPQFLARLSSSLKDRIEQTIGDRFDQEILDEISRRIKDELRHRMVTMKVARGSKPDHVKVVFEISARKHDGDVVVPRLLYHSKQNFSFGLDGTWTVADHRLSAGILTDNDELIERYSGIRGGFGRHNLIDGHLNLDAEAEAWRAQWNPAVQTALADEPDVPGIYRTRVHFQPSATIVFSEPLTLQLGVSLERLQLQFPAARHELASAAFTTLRFRRRWELTPASRHEIDSHYDLRSATRSLDSDFVYTRHSASFQYGWRGLREEIIASFQGGSLNGRAPLFERFALGNSRTLRGWNKYDVDPLGGDRMIHGSLDYRFRSLRLVYDTGSAWRRGAPIRIRHSLAFGVTHKGPSGFSAMIAFPIREGSIDPVFITGINF